MSDVIRLLIVDDHPVVREGLRSFLGSSRRPGGGRRGRRRRRCGHRGRAPPPRRRAARPRDARGRRRGRLAPAAGARPRAPRSSCSPASAPTIRSWRRCAAGASGWLGKDVPPSELESAIRTVHRGGSVLDPAVAGRVLAEVAHPSGHDPGLDQLTAREREVLALLGEGLVEQGAGRSALRGGEDREDPRLCGAQQAPPDGPHPGRPVRGPARPRRGPLSRGGPRTSGGGRSRLRADGADDGSSVPSRA